DDGRPVQIRRGGQLPYPLRPHPRTPQRVENRHPERLRIVLVAPHRHPRRALVQTLRRNPGAQQKRLPAARRRRHVHHTLAPAEQPKQAGPRTQPRSHTKASVFGDCGRVGHDAHGCTATILSQAIVFIRTMRGALIRPAPNLIACQPTTPRAAVASRSATRSASEGRSARRSCKRSRRWPKAEVVRTPCLSARCPTTAPCTGGSTRSK